MRERGAAPKPRRCWQLTLQFLRAAISFIPVAMGDDANMRNAAFILTLPAGDFMIQAGNGDWEFVFTQEQDGNIYGRCVRQPVLRYMWDAFRSVVVRIPLSIAGPSLLALAF